MSSIQSKLVATIFTKQQYRAFFDEDSSIPHIAMVGRSNVGKSSLIHLVFLLIFQDMGMHNVVKKSNVLGLDLLSFIYKHAHVIIILILFY